MVSIGPERRPMRDSRDDGAQGDRPAGAVARIPPMSAPPRSRVEQAYLALSRGSALLGRSGDRADAVLRAHAPLRARVLRNRLRELDRLAAILLDEIAAAGDGGAAHVARVRRRRSVAAKLGAVRGLCAIDDPDQIRLDAIRRVRARLARGIDPPAPADELAAIYRFYGMLANSLVAAGRLVPGVAPAC